MECGPHKTMISRVGVVPRRATGSIIGFLFLERRPA